MGEAKRKRMAGIAPKAAVIEEGISKLMDGQVPIRCGHCREAVVPQAMIFYGDCDCGSAGLSIHASEKVHRGALAGALIGLISALLEMYCTRRSPDGASHYCQGGSCPVGNGEEECIEDRSNSHRAGSAGLPQGNA